MKTEQKEIARRWGVSVRTLQNWQKVGAVAGVAPPLEAADPEEFLKWYRDHIGREPARKVLEAAEAMVAVVTAEDAEWDVEIDRAPIELLARTCARLGLTMSLARVVEEEDRAWAQYEETRRQGQNLDAALRRWKQAQEVKRQLQKSDDAVAVALDLLKQWVRREWEPHERAVREAISGKELGRKARKPLMGTSLGAEWERTWDAEMEKAIGGVID